MKPPLPARSLDSLPVFPLPGVVLFPGTVVPLHVFEPRYVAMLEDVLVGDRALGIVMLMDDGDAEAARAPVHEIACAGKIVHDERLPDRRYNILVHGVTRVHLVEELSMRHGYRRFRAEEIPPPSAQELERAGPELARLQSSILSLSSSIEQTDQQLVEVIRATNDPIELADILSAVLIEERDCRQRLLATTSLRERLGPVIDAVVDAMVRVGEPPAAAKMN